MQAVSFIPPLSDFVLDQTPTGSAYTCDPPVRNTDVDFVVLVNDLLGFSEAAMKCGWELAIKPYEGMAIYFVSMRLGAINVIAVDDADQFQRWKAATAVAKRLNLLSKADRVAVFHAVLSAEVCGPRDEEPQ